MKRCFAYFALIVFTVGCATVPERQLDDFQLAAMQYLQQQKSWSFEGRLALAHESDSVSASILWRHLEHRDDIELVGPLGQGRLLISVEGGRVVVDDGEVRNEFSGSPDDVLAKQLNVHMPVNALRFWVLGVNEPGADFVEQPGGFFQSGWLVRYREMQRVDSRILPKKITVQKDKTRIKLIVDQWDLS